MGFIAKEGDVFPEKSIPLLVCPIATTPAEAGMADRAAKEATAFRRVIFLGSIFLIIIVLTQYTRSICFQVFPRGQRGKWRVGFFLVPESSRRDIRLLG